MRLPRRAIALTATIASIAPALGLFGAVPAGADPIGSCTTTSGTIIAVDFGHWGGPIVRGCGVNPANGYALLHAAGFSTAGDNHDGPGYICRIGNQAFGAGTQYPTPAQDACIVTPPSTAYWSYWYARVGQSTWTYSSVGALGGHPAAGEVDLWVFGGTDLGGSTGSAVPRVAPDSLRARNPTPSATSPGTPTTRAPGPGATTGTTPGASTAPNANGPGPLEPNPVEGPSGPTDPIGPGPTRPGPTHPGPTLPGGATRPTHAKPTVPTIPPGGGSVSTTAAPQSAAPQSGEPRVVDALPAVQTSHSAGSVVPVLIGAGLVLALGGGAAGAWRRRRQHE